MKSVRNGTMWVLLGLAVVVLGCSGGGGAGPTAPGELPEAETGEFSASKKGGSGGGGGGGGKNRDNSEYSVMIEGLIPATFEGFFSTGSLSIARRFDCAIPGGGGANGLAACNAVDIPDSATWISFLQNRFPGQIDGCFTKMQALNEIILLQPSKPNPNGFELIIDFTADTSAGNAHAFHSFVVDLTRDSAPEASWPPGPGEVFDLVVGADDKVELVPGRKRNSCAAGPVDGVAGRRASVQQVGAP